MSSFKVMIKGGMERGGVSIEGGYSIGPDRWKFENKQMFELSQSSGPEERVWENMEIGKQTDEEGNELDDGGSEAEYSGEELSDERTFRDIGGCLVYDEGQDGALMIWGETVKDCLVIMAALIGC